MLYFKCSCGKRFRLNEDDPQVVPVPHYGLADKGTRYYTRCKCENCMHVLMIYREEDFSQVDELVDLSSGGF